MLFEKPAGLITNFLRTSIILYPTIPTGCNPNLTDCPKDAPLEINLNNIFQSKPSSTYPASCCVAKSQRSNRIQMERTIYWWSARIHQQQHQYRTVQVALQLKNITVTAVKACKTVSLLIGSIVNREGGTHQRASVKWCTAECTCCNLFNVYTIFRGRLGDATAALPFLILLIVVGFVRIGTGCELTWDFFSGFILFFKSKKNHAIYNIGKSYITF